MSSIFNQTMGPGCRQGGMGRIYNVKATGEKLGNPAPDQAQGPFLNPKEQALPDSACVVHQVCNGSYADQFAEVWGVNVCDISWRADTEALCAGESSTIPLSDEDRDKSDTAYDIGSASHHPWFSSFGTIFGICPQSPSLHI